MIYLLDNGFNGLGFPSCTKDFCLDYLSQQEEIGLDIETTSLHKGNSVYKGGLDPYLSSIVMLQIGTEEIQFVIDTRHFNIEFLRPIFEGKILKVGHNLNFEYRHLLKLGFRIENLYDTMLMEQCLYNGLGYKNTLEAVSDRYLGTWKKETNLFTDWDTDESVEKEEKILNQEYIDKSIRMGFLGIKDNLFNEKQVKYGADDILIPLKVRKLQMQSDRFSPILANLENKFLQVLGDCSMNGFYFNSNEWLAVYDTNTPLLTKKREKLNEYICSNIPFFCQETIFGEKENTIQWTSSKQVVELFKHLGCCPKEKSKQTKKLEYTVGAKALTKLLDIPHKRYFEEGTEINITNTQSLIVNYLQLKELEQACTTFGKDWLKYVHPLTNKVHPSYRQILNTGRISCHEPNIQQIPQGNEYRNCFKALGGVFVDCDYSAQEIFVIADSANETKMIEFLKGDSEELKIHNGDFHSYTATLMYRLIDNNPDLLVTKKTHPDKRQNAKAVNFKISFGGSAFTLKDDFGVDEKTAQSFIDGYFNAFPDLKANFEYRKKRVLEKHEILIDPYTGRKWYSRYKDRLEELDKEKQEIYSKYKNKWDASGNEPRLKEIGSEYYTIVGKLERNALNYSIQGLAASMTKLAGILIRNWIKKNNYWDKCKIITLVHDQILGWCTEDMKDEFAQVVSSSMEKASTYFLNHLTCKAEPEINTFWKK